MRGKNRGKNIEDIAIILMCCCSLAFSQAPQSQNNFMGGLAVNAMNNIKSLGNLPNAMTMSQKCNMGVDMSAVIQYPQSGSPINSGNPMNPFMSGNALCPCLTFDPMGCPVCKCRQPNTTSKANDTQRVPFHPQRTTLRRPSTSLTPKQLQTSTTSRLPVESRSPTSQNYTPDRKTTRNHRTQETSRFYVTSTTSQVTEGTTSDVQVFDFTLQRGRSATTNILLPKSAEKSFHNDTVVILRYEPTSLNDEKSFPYAVLFCCTTVAVTILSVVFFRLWRKSRKTLNREKNELYFVEKSVRNSSIVSTLLDLEKKSKRESIYSQVGIYPTVDSDPSRTSPDLPPRTPSTGLPLTPTAPPVSPDKERTSFKFPPDDMRHDYLELI